MDIVWEQPPEELVQRSGRGPGHYVEFALALRERPNEWALLPGLRNGNPRTESSGKGTAQNIRRGKVHGFNRGEYEAVSTGGKVWVRFTGEKKQPGGVVPVQPKDHQDLARRARAWARDQGMNVSTAGNLPRNIIEAYCKHVGITPPGPRAVES